MSALRPGDVVLVRPGGRVPADGTIVDGDATIDESMITGESRPVHRRSGDTVVAGTVSTDSSLRIRVDAIGDETALAGIQRLVADAQASRSRAQVLADRAAAGLFYLAMFAAIVAMIGWSAVGDPAAGIVAVVTVLVIACPHALGLAIPLVIAISTSICGSCRHPRRRSPRPRADAKHRTVLFDKTGTLTRGNHAVIARTTIAGYDADDMLRRAAAAEGDSEHPIARAIIAAAGRAGPLRHPPTSRAHRTWGASHVDGRTVRLAAPPAPSESQITEPDELAVTTDGWRERGNAVIYVLDGDDVIGAITVADEIRPESRASIESLHERGTRVVLVTGDAQQVADAIAADLGIDEVFAEVLPADKDATVAALQARGLRVAMVGDGVNDAPALARADVGIAIGAGTDVAIESARVVLVSDDPRGVTGVIDLSRATYRKMVQNLVWATGYNLAAIPVAAGALAFAGITIPPALAAIAMSLSTIVVAANAQLLRRLDLRPTPMGTG